MPYLHLDLAKTYPSEIKRELATRLCRLYADVMLTELWRPNVGIAELGADNLFHLGAEGLEQITMVLVETRRGRSLDQRLELGRGIVDICGEVLGVRRGRSSSNLPFTAATRCCVMVNGWPTGRQRRQPRPSNGLGRSGQVPNQTKHDQGGINAVLQMHHLGRDLRTSSERRDR